MIDAHVHLEKGDYSVEWMEHGIFRSRFLICDIFVKMVSL